MYIYIHIYIKHSETKSVNTLIYITIVIKVKQQQWLIPDISRSIKGIVCRKFQLVKKRIE